jgi:hypothetical protein
MRSTHTENSESDTRLLTSRQGSNLLNTRQTSDSESTQVASVVLFDLTRELVLQELHGRHGAVQLIDMMLGEISDTTSSIVVGTTRIGLNGTGEQLDEGRFTSSVRTDDGDTRVELDIDIDIFENNLGRGVTESSLVQLEQGRRDLFGLWESESL